MFFIDYPYSTGNAMINIQSKKIYAILHNSNTINFGQQLEFFKCVKPG